MANKEAKLNLVITAKDEAKAVIEGFATGLRSTFDNLQNSMKQALNMDGVKQEVQSAMSTTRGELDKTTQSMQHMSKGIDFQNLQMAGQMVQDTGHKITGFFEQAAHNYIDFDQSIVNATASLDANLTTTKLSTQQIKDMSSAALKMGEDGFFTANQIAESMNTLARQGLTYQDIMKGGIEVVKNVAVANQQDLDQTANVVADIYNEMGDQFRATGMTAQESAQLIGNSMTVALHHARIEMDDFMNTMKYVGPQASAAGIGIKDVSAAIAILGQHGIKGSQAGTTLRRMLTNLQPQSKAAATEMEKLGMVTKNGANIFYDAHGKMKDLATVQGLLHDKLSGLNPEMQQMAIKTIFGQYALSGMTAIVNTSKDKWGNLTKEMNDNNLMSDIVKQKSQGLGVQLGAVGGHFITLTKTIGESLRPQIQGLINGAQSLMKWWDNLSEPTRTLIARIGAIVGVVLLVGGGIMTFIGTLGMFASAVAGVTGAAGLGGLLVTFGWVIAIVAAVGLAIYGLYQAWTHNFGGIQEKTKVVWDWVKTQFKAAMDYVVPIVMNAVKAVTTWWHTMEPTFEKAIHNIYAAIVWLKPLWEAIWAVIKFVVKMVFDGIVDTIKHAWGLISGIVQLFADLIAGNWSKIFGDLWKIVKNAVLLVLDLFGGKLFKGGTKILGELGGFIGKWVVTLFNRFKAWADSLGGVFGWLWKTASSIFSGGLKIIHSLFTNGWSIVTNIFNAFKNLFTGNIKGFWSNIQGIFKGAVHIVGDVVGSIFKTLDKMFGGLPSKALNWAHNMMDMFISGIKSKIAAIGSAVSNIGGTIKKFIGFHSPAEEGPASEADVWMPNMMKMFTQGITDHTPKIEAAIGSVALGIKTGITSTSNTVQQMNMNTPNIPAKQQQQNGNGMVININVDGRSYKTDNELAENIAKKIYSQMAVVS